MYVMTPHELSVINTEASTAASYKIEPEEIYGRARDKYFTFPGMVTLATEAGFYTYDAATGRKLSHVAHEVVVRPS